jgi:hypothetical protein
MASLSTIIIYSILSALAMWVLLLKTGKRNVRIFLGFEAVLDIAFSALMFVAFTGTITGILTAVIGGLAFSGLLRATRMAVGYAKWNWKRSRWEFFDSEGYRIYD